MEGEIMKERKGTLKTLKNRIKGMTALGLSIAMMFGIAPSIQAKAYKDISGDYESYEFVRCGDEARLYGDRGGSGDNIYYSESLDYFSGNYYLNKDLTVTEKGMERFDSLANKDDMSKTVTIKSRYVGSGLDLYFGYIGRSGNCMININGTPARYVGNYIYSRDDRVMKAGPATVNYIWYDRNPVYISGDMDEVDITLNTEKPQWVIDLTVISDLEKISFDQTALSFKEGDTAKKLTIVPKLSLDRLEWNTSDAGVATVDQTGTVTPVKAGVATITATMKGKENITANCTVSVTEEPTVDRSADTLTTGLKITQKKNGNLSVSWENNIGASKFEVLASYVGKNATEGITTEGNSVVIDKIDGGKINTKSIYQIYVVAYDSKGNKIGTSLKAFVAGKDSKKYTNAKKVSAIKKVSLKKGKNKTVKANVTLSDKKKKALPTKYAKKVRFISSDTSIATVSANGKIKGVAKGKCTVYAIAQNGLAAKISVTVN
jgi:hypothetical protein